MNRRPDSAAHHPVLQPHERQRCEIWTRVMGYHRPVSSFNVGKQGEFNERVYFSETAACAPRPQPQAVPA